MHWVQRYKGLPFSPRGRTRDGVDCWGVVRMVYAEVLGIELPSYADAKVTDEERAEVERIFRGEIDNAPWTEVPDGDERPFDLAYFRRFADGAATHVGVVLGGGLMLHAEEGPRSLSRVESYRESYYAKLLVGFRRHSGVVSHAA